MCPLACVLLSIWPPLWALVDVGVHGCDSVGGGGDGELSVVRGDLANLIFSKFKGHMFVSHRHVPLNLGKFKSGGTAHHTHLHRHHPTR